MQEMLPWERPGVSGYHRRAEPSSKSKLLFSHPIKTAVTAEAFQTANGMKTGMLLDSIKQQLPSLKAVARYVNDSEHDTLDVYDDIGSGIAFDVRNRAGKPISTAVYVHFPNESVNNTYLTIYPGWRKL